MFVGQAYTKWLSPREQEAIAASCTYLIDAFFDEWSPANWQEDTLLATRLGKHLPRQYASQYTPLFLKQFGISIVTVAWKLAQPKPLRPASHAEELAAWAIVEEAREIIKQEGKGEASPLFQAFVDEYFEDSSFLALFDELPPTAERDSCENWFQPKAAGQAFIPHPYACHARTNVGRAYKQWLSQSKRKALAAGIDLLIDQFFDDFAHNERDELEAVADTTLAWHLPPHYLPKYSHQFLKQFSVCIITVAWKLTQPKPAVLSSLAEEIAAWAILTTAQVHIELAQEVNHKQTIEDLFGSFIDMLFEDTDFLFLFDQEYDGIENTTVGQMLGMTSLAFADWLRPFGDDPSYMVHPYVFRSEEDSAK